MSPSDEQQQAFVACRLNSSQHRTSFVSYSRVADSMSVDQAREDYRLRSLLPRASEHRTKGTHSPTRLVLGHRRRSWAPPASAPNISRRRSQGVIETRGGVRLRLSVLIVLQTCYLETSSPCRITDHAHNLQDPLERVRPRVRRSAPVGKSRPAPIVSRFPKTLVGGFRSQHIRILSGSGDCYTARGHI